MAGVILKGLEDNWLFSGLDFQPKTAGVDMSEGNKEEVTEYLATKDLSDGTKLVVEQKNQGFGRVVYSIYGETEGADNYISYYFSDGFYRHIVGHCEKNSEGDKIVVTQNDQCSAMSGGDPLGFFCCKLRQGEKFLTALRSTLVYARGDAVRSDPKAKPAMCGRRLDA